MAAPAEAGDFTREGGEPAMSFLIALIDSFRTDEEGQGLAEYALILALIAVVAIVALIFLGGQINTILSNVGNNI
jgi:pilus assembly protein Flp/PilA